MSAEITNHAAVAELAHQQQNNLVINNETFSEYDRLKALAITGASLGVLHVLAGPDHLSALAALAVGNSYKAFNLGFRWGIGHSTGLIVVAIIFIYLKGNLDLKLLGRYCDGLVGAFMMLLGSYGVFAALEVSRQNNKKRDDSISSSSRNSKSNNVLLTLLDNSSSSNSNMNTSNNNNTSTSPTHGSSNNPNNNNYNFHSEIDSNTITKKAKKKSAANHYNNQTSGYIDSEKGGGSGGNNNLYTSIDSIDAEDDDKYGDNNNNNNSNNNNNNNYNNLCAFLSMIDMREPFIQRIVSFSIGLLHGVAGPGGILGVLPAVEMRSWKSSTTYLVSFVIASTLSMGIFASLYGELTKRLGATQQCVDLSLRVFSSMMSIIVGILWFVLSVFGNKEKYFH